MKPKPSYFLIAWVMITTVALTAVGSDDLTVSRHTINGGGVADSTGGNFELSGTIGQPVAGVRSGGELELSGGFWFPLATGDCNSDGGVNAFDYSDFGPCLSGPGTGLLTPDCNCFDIDNDEDVDLSDVAQFQRSFTGG
ncbi:MAG: hypothetical protein ACYTFA_01100 [Planctomycetota bacterium]|jgi:hypothetical protein